MKVNCPFEKQHVIQADNLKAHIQKCKSPNKLNFQRCRYNSDHWIKFNKIKEHEQQCAQQQECMNSQISIPDDSVLQEFYEAISDSKLEGIEKQLHEMKKEEEKSREAMKKKKKKRKMQQQEEQPKAQLWKQPVFKDWLLHHQSHYQQMLDDSRDYENDFSQSNIMQPGRRY